MLEKYLQYEVGRLFFAGGAGEFGKRISVRKDPKQLCRTNLEGGSMVCWRRTNFLKVATITRRIDSAILIKLR